MKKEKVVALLHKRINKASKKIDELALQIHLGKADAKKAFDERIKSLESQKIKLRDEVHHMKYQSTTTWEDLAEGCQNSWSEMKISLRKAADDFKA